MKRVVLFLVLFTAGAAGQQAVQLSVDEAVQFALEKSPAIHLSLMKVQYADARASESGAALLPSLKFAGSYARLSSVDPAMIPFPTKGMIDPTDPSGKSVILIPTMYQFGATVVDNYNLKLTLQQPIFTGFRLSKSAEIAEYNAKSAAKDFDKDRSELVYNVRQAYWNLFKAIELLKVVDENVEQMKAHVRDVQNMQAQGLVTMNDVLKVQVQMSDAQLRQIDMRNTVQLARIALNSTLGLPLDTDVHLTSVVKHEPRQFPELPALLTEAYAKRPELQSMEYRVKAGDAAVTAARGGWWPQVFLAANYLSARPNQRIFPTKDEFRDTWDVGVSVSFDIWNWGATAHQTDQAKAQLAQAEDGMVQLRDGVTLDVTKNYLNLSRSKERINVAETGVRQAEENYRMTNAKFKQGLSLNSDLLDAEVALLQAKTNYTQAVVDAELAEAALARSIGE